MPDRNLFEISHKSELRLKLRNGLTIAVPASLSAITTYVLLEQEEWFEKEAGFVRSFLKPGMTAIDIGANLGLYSLPMADLVGADGHIFSYEPGRDARALLENSAKLNGLENIEVIGWALSDGRKEGHLAFAGSTELRALGSAGSGEAVVVTSLDLESDAHHWSSVDFVKIDAEGEEERIIAGGRRFFADYSPLVMFEIKAGDKVNERLRTIFPDIGYRVFRQLAGKPILVPDNTSQPLDGYELNLFAAKSDRAKALFESGLLVDNVADWMAEEAVEKFVSAASQGPTRAPVPVVPVGGFSVDAGYQSALQAYAIWLAADRPIAMRCAALAFALKAIRAACTHGFVPERASTWARIASEWGARAESVAILRQLLQMLGDGQFQLKEPFWPAAGRFDDIAVHSSPADWFAVAAAEQYERAFSYSTLFGGASPFLSWLCGQRLSSTEMIRRRTLIAARAGLRPKVPERLCIPAPDHLNAEIWRSGMIPGTVV